MNIHVLNVEIMDLFIGVHKVIQKMLIQNVFFVKIVMFVKVKEHLHAKKLQNIWKIQMVILNNLVMQHILLKNVQNVMDMDGFIIVE